MFVVQRNTPQTPDSSRTTLLQTRSATPSRQRGSTGTGSDFRQSTVTQATRADDTSPSRVNSQKTVTTPAAVENSSEPRPGNIVTSPTGEGVQKLLDAMSALGMSTSGVKMEYQENLVMYPGGQYVDKQIQVTSGGKTEQFSALLTDKNPYVTAYEMQSYFGIQGTGGNNGALRKG
ncbi:MAG TPA: hypothetical protein VFQ91_23625 [Bryobacteraceae bacterium]|nr:hypothetical protein [Bryobacteraceae bacterium]